jgi:predicted membrane channel-forming protein YqfA (hemolysin III family)
METLATILTIMGFALIGLGGLFYVLGCLLNAIASKEDRTPVWHEYGKKTMRIEFIEERAEKAENTEYFILNHNEFKQHTQYYEN